QNHVGKHILCSLRGVHENNIVTPVGEHYPCGFCGQSTLNGTCVIGILHGQANSSCSDAYKFKIAAASKSSISKPCTNVPIACIMCNSVHWKYNMDAHLLERHPNWELTVAKEKRDAFLSRMCISESEETHLGIIKSTAP
ncbi:hypothetical protein B0H14DRAFT_2248143, partial [Mycena olivaceomarginata]